MFNIKKEEIYNEVTIMRNLKKSNDVLITFNEVHETKQLIIVVLKYKTGGKSYLQCKTRMNRALVDCFSR